MNLLRTTLLSTLLGLCSLGAAQEAAPAIEVEGPAQLLERGRTAFEAADWAVAEEALEKFIRDYGAADEAKEAARIHRPLVAISKIGLAKYGEALEWIETSLTDPKIEFALADELRFWRGICLMTQSDLTGAQRAFGEYWAIEGHNAFKRYEALLLFATLYIQQDFPETAAEFLASQIPKMREAAPEAAGRAVILELYSLILAKKPEAALAVIRREYPRMDEMTQVISFQTMALQLGSEFLEAKDYYNAITCMQRIWSQEKLLEFQSAKVAEIKDRITVMEQRPDGQSIAFQLRAILKRVERELENFQQLENFDAALQLRVAMSYQGLERYREAALIMEEMLVSMSPSPVVESATLAQLQCWMEIRRWPKAVEAAERYEQKFAEGEHLPTVLFLKAEALREDLQYSTAQLAYGDLVDRFPADPFAPKALFMQGFLYLQQDDNDGAFYQFDQVAKLYPESEMVEDSDYWTGMAYSFSGQYEEAREHLAGYQERYETPKYRKESVFRIAVCTFSLAEYDLAIERLAAFDESYPGDPLTDEANLLLGDAWLGEGEMEKGFAAYERVRPSSGRFFEDAWFKKGNAYKLFEKFEKMRTHFEEFVATYPTSARMPEAVYWIGWTSSNEGDVTTARDAYWATIDEHGDDPEMSTVLDLFSALPKLYPGENGAEDLLTRLQTTKTRAAVAEQYTLAARAGWAKAQVLAKNSSAAQTELLDIAKWIDPKDHSPALTVPIAEALLAVGNETTAANLFVEIRRWHPRAVERGRIYRALGRIAANQGEIDKALGYFERFEREAFSAADLGEVRLEKAELFLASGQKAKAREAWEAILGSEGISAAVKAKSLLAIGETLAEEGEHKQAIVYLERVYVAYGKFADLNAKAYWQRGQSLEELALPAAALETYEELLSRDELSRFDEVEKAQPRVVVLRRLVPAEPAEEEAAL